jgi:hypothetical protein
MVELKWFLSLEKEEAWLNDKLQQGYMLTRKGIFYHFDLLREKTGQDIVADIRQFKSKQEYNAYIDVLVDNGFYYITGSYHSCIHYLLVNHDDRKNILDMGTGFRYLRLSRMFEAFWWIMLALTLALVISNGVDYSIIFNPSDLFLTPNLFSYSGVELVIKVLFEIPFILFRLFYTYFLVIWTLVMGVYSIRYYRWYRAYDSNGE